MESSQARQAAVREGAARTLAQTACIGGGLLLIAVGILGFFFGGSGFNTGDAIQGQEFLGFEVNGWHNIVHIGSGAFLLLMSPKAKSAITGLLVFGVVYVLVTIWGFIDGNTVATLIPVNLADNVLHAFLAGAALLVVAVSGGFAAASRKAEPSR